MHVLLRNAPCGGTTAIGYVGLCYQALVIPAYCEWIPPSPHFLPSLAPSPSARSTPSLPCRCPAHPADVASTPDNGHQETAFTLAP